MTEIALSPVQIIASIQQTWGELLLREQSRPTKQKYIYATGYSPCTRRMVLDLTEGDKRPGWTADQLARFERGEDRERNLLWKLNRVGAINDPPFKVIGQQERFELRDRKGRVAIVGKVDARLDFGVGLHPPVEIKNWAPWTTDRIHSFEDLFASPWTRSAGYQIPAYLLASGEPIGFLLLDRPGIPALIPVELEKNLDRMEAFLQQAEIALDHKEAGTLPGYIDDLEECGRCWCFQMICDPPTTSPAAKVVLDSEIEAKLERREQIKAIATQFIEIDEEIKRQFRGTEYAVCGPFSLEGKWSANTTYEIPKDIKDKYRHVDPKGRFSLKITKL